MVNPAVENRRLRLSRKRSKLVSSLPSDRNDLRVSSAAIGGTITVTVSETKICKSRPSGEAIFRVPSSGNEPRRDVIWPNVYKLNFNFAVGDFRHTLR